MEEIIKGVIASDLKEGVFAVDIEEQENFIKFSQFHNLNFGQIDTAYSLVGTLQTICSIDLTYYCNYEIDSVN